MTAPEIERWLTAYLVNQMGLDDADVSPEEPLETYQLDSLQTVAVISELGDWMGWSLSAHLLYDCATIREVAIAITEDKHPAPR